jgi:[ribosomal protein S18]-alanine N-acetyltransferase
LPYLVLVTVFLGGQWSDFPTCISGDRRCHFFDDLPFDFEAEMSIWNKLLIKAEPPAMDAAWIRPVLRRDLEEIVEIESRSFERSWDRDDFRRAAACRNATVMVAEQKDRIVGYVVYEFQRSHFEIINLAVSPESRRQQIGASLVANVIAKLGAYRRQVTASVSEFNLPAQLFFKSREFICTRVESSRFDCGLDAYQFVYTKGAKDGLSVDTRKQR